MERHFPIKLGQPIEMALVISNSSSEFPNYWQRTGLSKMERQISVGIFRPKYVDHLQRWSRIFRSKETETVLAIWIPTEITGIFGIMESTFGQHQLLMVNYACGFNPIRNGERRVQITPKTSTNISRYLYSRGPARQVCLLLTNQFAGFPTPISQSRCLKSICNVEGRRGVWHKFWTAFL